MVNIISTNNQVSENVEEMYQKRKLRWIFLIITSVLITILCIFFAIMFGPAGPFGPSDTNILTVYQVFSELVTNTVQAIFKLLSIPVHEETSIAKIIVWELRFPRVIMGALVGMALAVAGTIMQAIFRNPMADPFIIGIASGASVGASIAIIAGGTVVFLAGFILPIFAFVGALVTLLVVYFVANVRGTIRTDTLLLSGIAVGSFMAAVTSFLTYFSGEYLRPIIFWLMGGLTLVEGDWESVVISALIIIPSCIICVFYSRPLNLLLLGEETARHRGLNVQQMQRVLLVLASLITGVSVAFTGVIGFVGLIIPHMVRLIAGPDHRVLLPISAFSGASFLILADVIAKTILFPSEVPVGIITAFCGAPFFLYLLRRHKRIRILS